MSHVLIGIILILISPLRVVYCLLNGDYCIWQKGGFEGIWSLILNIFFLPLCWWLTKRGRRIWVYMHVCMHYAWVLVLTWVLVLIWVLFLLVSRDWYQELDNSFVLCKIGIKSLLIYLFYVYVIGIKSMFQLLFICFI